MSTALTAHARKNVWAEPAQDYQYNIGLARLSPNGGVIHSQNVLWHMVRVPKGGNRTWYHIYQIGQVPPKLFSLDIPDNTWMKVDDLAVSQSMVIDLYLESGGMIPRSRAWLMKDLSRNFIIAIEHDRKFDYGTDVRVDKYTGVVVNRKITLDTDKVIARFYVNAHFSNYSFRDQAVNPLKPIQMAYRKINTQEDYEQFMLQCNQITASFMGQGKGIYYRDGFAVNRPRLYSEDLIGKELGFMWDESFKFEQFFDLKDLHPFTSKLDINRKKWILFTDSVYDIIDFHDDIDFYLVKRDASGFKGVYISRVKDYAIRMLTHSAYSIDAELLEYYSKTHSFLKNLSECSVYAMVRQGGKLQGLINQKNRIEELYSLESNEAIVDAMVNTNSVVPEWRADELENSAYTALMRADAYQIEVGLVQEAYGYAMVSQIMCPPVHTVKRIGQRQQIQVPPGLQIPDNVNGFARRCAFCYDGKGRLINYFSDASSDIYIDIPPEVTGTETVEVFNGLIDDDSGTYVNMNVVNNDLEQYGFRCYVSTLNALIPVEDWVDVTNSTNWYTYTPGNNETDATLTWNWNLLDQAGLYPAVKTNAKINLYSSTHEVGQDRDGCVNVVVRARQIWSGEYTYRVQRIPPGQVTVFANGLSLIEDIDYYMNWPNIVIVNREINNSTTVEVIVRSYGCGYGEPGELARPFKPREVGFVKNGRLSSNDQYDIHNDKNLRIVVADEFKRREQVNFAEDDLGELSTDGRPYSIEDYILPVENYTLNRRTNEFYLETLSIENRVSDYLTLWKEEPNWGQNVIVGKKWEVVSPVLASMCYAILNGYAIDENTNENFDNLEVDVWLSPYAWLLDYDPAYLKVDTGFVHIAPHPFDNPITMTQKQYELLETIIKLKLNGLVDLSRYIKIETNPLAR